MNETRLSEAAANVAAKLQQPSLASAWLASLVICLDLPTFATALWFAQYVSVPPSGFEPLGAAGAGFLAAALAVGLLALARGYRPSTMREPWRAMLRTFIALVAPVTLVGSLVAGAALTDFLVSALLALATVIIPLRLIEARVVGWIIDGGLIKRRAVVAGGGEHAERLIRGLAAQPESDVCLYGIFDDRDDARSPPQVLGLPKIGGYDDLIAFVRNSEVDMVIVSLPLEAEERIQWLLTKLKVLPVEVRLSAFSEDYAVLAPSACASDLRQARYLRTRAAPREEGVRHRFRDAGTADRLALDACRRAGNPARDRRPDSLPAEAAWL